jgi:uncharacterized membrane protein YjfL (UPF0719 family)
MKYLTIVNPEYILSALIYAGVGCLILFLMFWIVEKLTPENLWKEILEKQNKALAILAGSIVLGIAIIIASAIHG